MKSKVASMLILATVVFIGWTILKGMAAADAQWAAYQALPAEERAGAEALASKILAAKPGDLLETTDGRVAVILRTEKLERSILVRVRRNSGELEYPLAFSLCSVRDKVAAVVSRDDPRAGELALRFLSQ